MLHKIHKNKGHKPIKDDDLLTRFCGGTYQIQNDHFMMYDLIFRMNNTKKKAMGYGLTKFSNDKIKEYQKENEEILELAK